MSKRLQLIVDDAEFRELQKVARARRMTLSEWVRQALRAARREQPAADSGRKLAAVRSAARHAFPTADIDAMLGEIEQGYLGPVSE
jgi:predicted transcriptional regulator